MWGSLEWRENLKDVSVNATLHRNMKLVQELNMKYTRRKSKLEWAKTGEFTLDDATRMLKDARVEIS